MGPTTHRTMSERSYHGAISRSLHTVETGARLVSLFMMSSRFHITLIVLGWICNEVFGGEVIRPCSDNICKY